MRKQGTGDGDGVSPCNPFPVTRSLSPVLLAFRAAFSTWVGHASDDARGGIDVQRLDIAKEVTAISACFNQRQFMTHLPERVRQSFR